MTTSVGHERPHDDRHADRARSTRTAATRPTASSTGRRAAYGSRTAVGRRLRDDGDSGLGGDRRAEAGHRLPLPARRHEQLRARASGSAQIVEDRRELVRRATRRRSPSAEQTVAQQEYGGQDAPKTNLDADEGDDHRERRRRRARRSPRTRRRSTQDAGDGARPTQGARRDDAPGARSPAPSRRSTARSARRSAVRAHPVEPRRRGNSAASSSSRGRGAAGGDDRRERLLPRRSSAFVTIDSLDKLEIVSGLRRGRRDQARGRSARDDHLPGAAEHRGRRARSIAVSSTSTVVSNVVTYDVDDRARQPAGRGQGGHDRQRRASSTRRGRTCSSSRARRSRRPAPPRPSSCSRTARRPSRRSRPVSSATRRPRS